MNKTCCSYLNLRNALIKLRKEQLFYQHILRNIYQIDLSDFDINSL